MKLKQIKFLENLVNPKNTALLVIDIQNDYCSKKGKLAKLRHYDFSPIEKIIPKLSEFIEIAREHKIPVVFTQMIEDPKYMKPNAKRKFRYGDFIKFCTLGTWGFDFYKIKPKKGDKIIIKRSYDAFTNKQLEKFLKKRKIQNLIITGFYTHVCVESTVRSAFSLGYDIIIPKDLVSVAKEKYNFHKRALKMFNSFFGYVINSKDIIKIWKKISE